MSDTPRTDAASSSALIYADQPASFLVVTADFARNLELEIAEVRRQWSEEVSQLQADLAAAKTALQHYRDTAEIVGQRCMDGGVCHHKCERACFRKGCCVPLAISGLDDDWKDAAIATREGEKK